MRNLARLSAGAPVAKTLDETSYRARDVESGLAAWKEAGLTTVP